MELERRQTISVLLIAGSFSGTSSPSPSAYQIATMYNRCFGLRAGER